jgi:DNA-binding ferritin-like protein (Dps family)
MTDRLRNLLMVFGLTHQLSVWLRFMVDMNDAKRDFKYNSKLLADMCDKYIANYKAMDDEIYEHSIQISDLFETIAKMDQKDINRVIGLINKMNKK